MKKYILFLIPVLLLISCGEVPTPIVNVNNRTDAGVFGLTGTTIGFDSGQSAALEPDGYNVGAELVYAPVLYSSNLDGAAPSLRFSFSKNLAGMYEGLFGISTVGTASDNYGIADSDTFTNFYVYRITDSAPATPVSVVSRNVSENTVTLNFAESAFSVDSQYLALFGVKSADGEIYRVSLGFQPIAEITETVRVSQNFDAYHAYAVDANEVIYLNPAGGDHINYSNAETVAGVGSSGDFGARFNTFPTRYGNNASTEDFDNLDDISNTNSHEYLTIDFTEAEYASSYIIEYQYPDDDGDFSDYFSMIFEPENDYSTSTASPDDIDYDSSTGAIFENNSVSYQFRLPIDSNSVISGSRVTVTPVNAIGAFDQRGGSVTLTDSVLPVIEAFSFVLDDVITPWAGEDWSTHDEDVAHQEGEIVSLSSYTPDFTGASEGLIISLNSASFNAVEGPGFPTDPGAEIMPLSTGDLDASFVSDEVTVHELGDELVGIWDGATLSIVARIACNDGSNGIDYSGTNVINFTGSTMSFEVTDLSGNRLIYHDGVDDEDVNNGRVNVTIQ